MSDITKLKTDILKMMDILLDNAIEEAKAGRKGNLEHLPFFAMRVNFKKALYEALMFDSFNPEQVEKYGTEEEIENLLNAKYDVKKVERDEEWSKEVIVGHLPYITKQNGVVTPLPMSAFVKGKNPFDMKYYKGYVTALEDYLYFTRHAELILYLLGLDTREHIHFGTEGEEYILYTIESGKPVFKWELFKALKEKEFDFKDASKKEDNSLSYFDIWNDWYENYTEPVLSGGESLWLDVENEFETIPNGELERAYSERSDDFERVCLAEKETENYKKYFSLLVELLLQPEFELPESLVEGVLQTTRDRMFRIVQQMRISEKALLKGIGDRNKIGPAAGMDKTIFSNKTNPYRDEVLTPRDIQKLCAFLEVEPEYLTTV